VQSHLLEQARVADPMLLARYATSLIDRLDQDGRYRELDHQQQRRQLRLVDRPDGSCRLEGYCTVEAAETAEQLRVFVDAVPSATCACLILRLPAAVPSLAMPAGWNPMHQQPPQTPLFASTSAAKSVQVSSVSNLVVYRAGSVIDQTLLGLSLAARP
jgi:hypothetical protein